jgi:hypothetical protein
MSRCADLALLFKGAILEICRVEKQAIRQHEARVVPFLHLLAVSGKNGALNPPRRNVQLTPREYSTGFRKNENPLKTRRGFSNDAQSKPMANPPPAP